MKKAKAKFKVNEVFLLQLYEKGLVSAKTVLEFFDIDVDKEVTPITQTNLEKDPEWVKLQKEQMFLSNQEYAAKIARLNADVISVKMEHARRNVEVLGKVFQSLQGLGENKIPRDTLLKALEVNTEILKEIGKI